MSYVTGTSDVLRKLENGEKPAIVDFWATWCAPCKMFAPVFEAVSDELGDKYVFCKVDVDDQPELASEFRIVSIPTVIIIDNGAMIKKNVGAMNETELKRFITESF